MTPNHSEDTGDTMPNLTPEARTRTGCLSQESVSEGLR